MARYRWKRGRFLSSSLLRRSFIVSSETSAGEGFAERRPDVGGAGSMEVYTLQSVVSNSAYHIARLGVLVLCFLKLHIFHKYEIS